MNVTVDTPFSNNVYKVPTKDEKYHVEFTLRDHLSRKLQRQITSQIASASMERAETHKSQRFGFQKN